MTAESSIHGEYVLPTGLVIIQATPFCNINCAYCYLPFRQDRSRIELETVYRIGRFLASVPRLRPNLPIVWHAGEPMVVPRGFYEEAFDRLAQPLADVGVIPEHNFQTNATLIDDSWCDFFLKHAIRVGVSLDGPERFHDAFRVDRQGRGTFARAMRGLETLKQRSVPFSVICVLSDEALNNPDELLQFFIQNDCFQIGFNVQEIEGANRLSNLHNPGIDGRYERFFERVLHWQQVEPRLRIRELADSARRLLSRSGRGVHSSENVLGSILNFNAQGGVSTFSPELLTSPTGPYQSFVWGDVETDTFSTFIERAIDTPFYSDLRHGINRCEQTCDFFEVCGGGAPSNKLAEHGNVKGTETAACRLQVKVLDPVVLTALEKGLVVNY